MLDRNISALSDIPGDLGSDFSMDKVAHHHSVRGTSVSEKHTHDLKTNIQAMPTYI